MSDEPCTHPRLDCSVVQTSGPPRARCVECRKWISCGWGGPDGYCSYCGEKGTVSMCVIETGLQSSIISLTRSRPTRSRLRCSECGRSSGPTHMS